MRWRAAVSYERVLYDSSVEPPSDTLCDERCLAVSALTNSGAMADDWRYYIELYLLIENEVCEQIGQLRRDCGDTAVFERCYRSADRAVCDVQIRRMNRIRRRSALLAPCACAVDLRRGAEGAVWIAEYGQTPNAARADELPESSASETAYREHGIQRGFFRAPRPAAHARAQVIQHRRFLSDDRFCPTGQALSDQPAG